MSGPRARSLLLPGVFCAAVVAALIFSVAGGDGQRVPTARHGKHVPKVGIQGVACRYVAAPNGWDQNRGTIHSPFQSLQRLDAALRPGQTGCLRGGTYTQNADLFRGGLPGRRVTIRSYPGERARLDGVLWITARARYVTVRDVTLCGAPGPGECAGASFSTGEASAVQVSGGHALFEYDEVSNASGICFILGTAQRQSSREGPGDHAAIVHSRIHNCGTPGQSNLIEGIYDEYSTGSFIAFNDIYDNAAMGIQFYPAAQDATFEYNIVWGNGEGVLFGGTDTATSNGNVVAHNVIGHSITRWNIESNWAGAAGVGNVAADNCLYADNPLGGGYYYDVGGGVQTLAAGAAGFLSRNETVGQKCRTSALHGLLRP